METSTQERRTDLIGPKRLASPASSGPLKELQSYLEPGRQPGSFGRLGHYEILELLGRGGFGIVVKALDQKLQRLVAIKILSPEYINHPTVQKYFVREARSAARVRHENVVQIHAVEEHPLPFLVMEYIEGRTLQQRLDSRPPLELEEIVRLGLQITHGLAAAHEQGLIHRDIKPANILLEKGDRPRVKITDFGLARAEDDVGLTQNGFIVGTPMYMAPEQANGQYVDHRADLFSLGSVLYTMISGRPPFQAPTTMAVLNLVANDTPQPIYPISNRFSPRLGQIIERLHAKSPSDRYRSAREVARELEQCLRESQPTLTMAILPRRSRAWQWGAALALLLAGGLIVHGAGKLSGRKQPPTPSENAGGIAQTPNVPEKVEVSKPLINTWERAVASMPVEDQVPAVVAKLKRLNPGFEEASVFHLVENNVVTCLRMSTSNVEDLSPISALVGLRDFRIEGDPSRPRLDLRPLRGLKLEKFHSNHNLISDLSPLSGMPLTELSLWGFGGSDLSALKGMRLTFFNCGDSQVYDLTPLRGMPLSYLCLNCCRVKDLSPLEGMPLTELLSDKNQVADLSVLKKMPLESLYFEGSCVTNLEPIRRMPLKHLSLNYVPERDRELLRSVKSLVDINKQSVNEFLAKTSN